MTGLNEGLERLRRLTQAEDEASRPDVATALDHDGLRAVAFRAGATVRDSVTAQQGVVLGTYFVEKRPTPSRRG